MYLARDLEFGETDPDDDEFIDVIEVPLEDAVKMVMDGSIPDAKTQLALLKTQKLISE